MIGFAQLLQEDEQGLSASGREDTGGSSAPATPPRADRGAPRPASGRGGQARHDNRTGGAPRRGGRRRRARPGWPPTGRRGHADCPAGVVVIAAGGGCSMSSPAFCPTPSATPIRATGRPVPSRATTRRIEVTDAGRASAPGPAAPVRAVGTRGAAGGDGGGAGVGRPHQELSRPWTARSASVHGWARLHLPDRPAHRPCHPARRELDRDERVPPDIGRKPDPPPGPDPRLSAL